MEVHHEEPETTAINTTTTTTTSISSENADGMVVVMDGDLWVHLSPEILLHIFRFCSLPSLGRVHSVCKAWNELAGDGALWREKLAKNHSDKTKLYTNQLIPAEPSLFKPLYYHLGLLDPAKSLSNLFSFNLLRIGVRESSKDHKSQSIQETLVDDDHSFWSSTGSADITSSEYLIYQLQQPICAVFAVKILPYMATYQQGQPIYAAQQVQLSVGFSPDDMHWQSPVFSMQNRHEEQTFEIIPYMAIGGYLRIDLHGRYQTQPQDDLYYTVLEKVSANGLPLGAISDSLITNSMIGFALQQDSFVNEMKSRSNALVDLINEFLSTQDKNHFSNMFSIMMTKDMLPFLGEEKKRHQGIVQVYELVQKSDFIAAAKLVSETPTLRTEEVFDLFRKFSDVVMKHYFNIMIKSGRRLTKTESLELVRMMLGEDTANVALVALWVASNRLTLSQELGDLVYECDLLLATRIYIQSSVPDKILSCLRSLGEFHKMVSYARSCGYKMDYPSMLREMVETNVVRALGLAVALLECQGGSPVDPIVVCECVGLKIGEDDWDLKKLLRKKLKEALDNQTGVQMEGNLADALPELEELDDFEELEEAFESEEDEDGAENGAEEYAEPDADLHSDGKEEED